MIKFIYLFKYLGLEIDGSTRKDLRGKWNEALARLASKGRSCLSLMMYQGGGANGLRPRTNVHQWKTCCRPILEYGCEIWEGEISVSLSDRLEAIQTDFCRATLVARDNLAAAAMRADLGLSTLKSHRLQRKLEKLCGADQERLLSLIFRKRHLEVSAGAARLSCLRSLQDALSRVGLADCWNSQSVSEDWFSRVRKSVSDAELEHQTEVLSEHSSLSFQTAEAGSHTRYTSVP